MIGFKDKVGMAMNIPDCVYKALPLSFSPDESFFFCKVERRKEALDESFSSFVFILQNKSILQSTFQVLTLTS